MKFLIIFALISLSVGQHMRDMAKQIYVGSALAAKHLSEDSQYKTTAQQEFNCLTPEYEMKWAQIEKTRNQPNYAASDQLVKFATDNNMKVRGHTLVWHEEVPTWVTPLNKTELDAAIKKHITEEMTHFKGKIYAWDVVNEVFNENGTFRDTIFYKAFNTSFIADAFRTARTVDPNAKLYINDYNTEGKNNKSDALYALVKDLKAQNVSIDGVGFQAHFALNGVPTDLASNLQRFVDLGVDVAITELDIRMELPDTTNKTNEQAQEYASVYKTCESISRCVGVTVWGFSDKYSWVPGSFSGWGDALLWDKDFKAKPAVTAVEAILK